MDEMMSEGTNESRIEAAVFDTSAHGVSGNWPWTNVKLDRAWDEVESLIHLGWPARHDSLARPSACLLGVMRAEKSIWYYRVFPAEFGKDPRGGRYFIVIFRLPLVKDILDPRVAGLLAYFETERGFPLRTESLEVGVNTALSCETARKFANALGDDPACGHSGMDETGTLVSFPGFEVFASPGNAPVISPRIRKMVITGAVAITTVAAFAAKNLMRQPESDDRDNGSKETETTDKTHEDAPTRDQSTVSDSVVDSDGSSTSDSDTVEPSGRPE